MSINNVKLKDENNNILYPKTTVAQVEGIEAFIPCAQYVDCNAVCAIYENTTSLHYDFRFLDYSKPIVLYNLYYKPNWDSNLVDYTNTTAQAIIYYSNGHYYENVRIYNFKNWTVTIASVSGFAGNFSAKVGTTISQNNESTIWTADLGTTKPSTNQNAYINISWDSGSQTAQLTIKQVGYNRNFNLIGTVIKNDNGSSASELYCALSGTTDYLKITTNGSSSNIRMIDQSATDKTRIDMSKFTFEFRTKNSTSGLGLKLATLLNDADKSKAIELHDFRLIYADGKSTKSDNICVLSKNGDNNIYEGYVVNDNQCYTLHITANKNAAGTSSDPYLSYYLYPIDNFYWTDNTTLGHIYTDTAGYDVNNTFEYTEDSNELYSSYSKGYVPTTAGKTGVYAYIRFWFYTYNYDDFAGIYFDYYQEGLNHNHYCCFSELDTNLATGWSDVTTNVKTTTQDVSGTGTVTYEVEYPGWHFVTVKFRKNNSAVVSPDKFIITGIRVPYFGNGRFLKTNPEKDANTYFANAKIAGSLIMNSFNSEHSQVGLCSTTEGAGCFASGDYSHAEGRNTIASGQASHAEGQYTDTNFKRCQHVFGEYNALDTGSVTRHSNTGYGTYVEIVGNGTSASARTNARTLDWSGNQWIAANESVQSLTQRSDKRLKENIKDYKCKNSILDLPIKEFDFKSNHKHSIGCIAQDLQKICPEIVEEGQGGFLEIQETKLIYLLLQEVKDLKKEIEELKHSK